MLSISAPGGAQAGAGAELISVVMRSLTVPRELVIRRSLLTIKQRIAVTKNNQEIEHKLKTTRYKMNLYKKYDKASNPILLLNI